MICRALAEIDSRLLNSTVEKLKAAASKIMEKERRR